MSTAQAEHVSSGFTRLKLILLLGVIVLGTVLLLAPGEALLSFSQILIDGPLLLAWIGAGWGIGHLVLAAARRVMPSDRASPSASSVLGLTTRVALGLGLLGLIVLGLGSIGVLNQVVALLLLAAGNGPTVWMLYRQQSAIGQWLRGATSGAHFLLAPSAVIAGAMLLGALVMPWILWGDEPHGYDVVAYHFQLPREWLEAGRITATPHNVFGYFPLGVEMHYLLAMAVRGSATAGMYLAQLMHAAMVLLTLGAIYGSIREQPRDPAPAEDVADTGSTRLRAAVAVVFAAAFPWLLMLGSVGYNEGGVLLFTTLALVWTLRGQYGLAGVFAGMAAGCKITSLPTLVAVLPALVLIDSLLRRRFEWRGVALLLLGSALALSPWLARNMVLTGNPVFPIAARSLGAGHFDAGMIERFEVAHAARPDQQTLGGRLSALHQQVLADFKFGSLRVGDVGIPLLLLVAMAAFALRLRDRAGWMLAAFIVANLVVWLFATHLQGRFLVPIIPAAALLVGGLNRRAEWIGVALISLVSMPLTFASVVSRLTAPAARAGIAYPDVSALLPEPLVKVLMSSPGRPVYLLGDARAFLYPVPTSRLRYRSIFDVSSTRPFKEAWLGESVPEDAIVVVVPSELARFERTYRNLPKMPDEWRSRPMFVTDAEFKAYVPVE